MLGLQPSPTDSSHSTDSNMRAARCGTAAPTSSIDGHEYIQDTTPHWSHDCKRLRYTEHLTRYYSNHLRGLLVDSLNPTATSRHLRNTSTICCHRSMNLYASANSQNLSFRLPPNKLHVDFYLEPSLLRVRYTYFWYLLDLLR
jgi:hypothetical protein